MFFSNTNRTNLTNLLDCDMVYIRGIREICGQLNIIQTRIFFFEHESHESDELFRLRPGIYSFDSGDLWSTEYNSDANMFFEHESDESDESCRLRHGIYSWDSGDLWSS